MYGPNGPEPEIHELKAGVRAEKIEHMNQLMREYPDTWFFGDIARLLMLILVVAILTMGLITASLFAPPYFAKWVLSTSPWIVWPTLAVFTLVVAWYARRLRDERKLKYYPFFELSAGVALSVQGVVQQGLMLSQAATFVAALIAFIAGLRITIDGWKRFYANDTKSLFSSHLILQGVREFYKP